MINDIVIPQIGEADSELYLVKWHKNIGDRVTEGEVLFELDIEKSVIEIESVYTGTLTEILIEAAEKVLPLQVAGKINTD